jgi:predicted DNA-binding transcriptional regulator AlpA
MDAVVEAALNPIQPHTRPEHYALPDILRKGKVSKAHVYNMMARGHFPQPVFKLGPRYVRWSAQSVDSWLEDPAAWIAAHAQKVAA